MITLDNNDLKYEITISIKDTLFNIYPILINNKKLAIAVAKVVAITNPIAPQ
jgi:hypothetical protein